MTAKKFLINYSTRQDLMKVENKLYYNYFNLANASTVYNMQKEGAKSPSEMRMLPVRMDSKFGAWQLPQKRTLVQRIFRTTDLKNQIEVKDMIEMNIFEGACLTTLGKITLDSDGKVEMSDLIAVMAGGVHEARKYLKL